MKQPKAKAAKKSKFGRFLRLSTLLGGGSAAYFLLYRPWQMNWGATPEEINLIMPGDELIPEPMLNSTRAITVDAPPEAIWPWLVQLGKDRGGWYSYEFIENKLLGLDIHNAERILPEYQHLKPGDFIPTGAPGVDIPVREVVPNHHLLIGGPEIGSICFWLEKVDETHTRLIIRNRGTFPMNPAGLFWMALMDPGIFVMMRKMLLTLKQRAENYYRQSKSKPIPPLTETAPSPALA
jgi:hypothetical protein